MTAAYCRSLSRASVTCVLTAPRTAISSAPTMVSRLYEPTAYLAGDARSGGNATRMSVSSQVAVDGFFQLFIRAVVRVVLVSLFPPVWSVESCSTTTNLHTRSFSNTVATATNFVP